MLKLCKKKNESRRDGLPRNREDTHLLGDEGVEAIERGEMARDSSLGYVFLPGLIFQKKIT